MPQADSTQASGKGVLIFLKILNQSTSSSSTMPQSSMVNQLISKLFDSTAKARTKPN